MDETADKPMNIRLLVNLMHIEPPIWRRILVPHGITLAQLHDVIQAAMGWENSHLHMFLIEGNRYGIPDEAIILKVFDAARERVHKVADKVYRRDRNGSYDYSLAAEDF